MGKKLLSIFLALSMAFTLLPVSALAEEADTPVGASGEIIAFAPLEETEKPVTVGTSIEELELPESLTATASSAIQEDEDEQTVSDKVYAPEGKEVMIDLPVTWISEPEYDMNIEGVYVFTPVIADYTVSAELPQITVTVGSGPPTTAARMLFASVNGLTEVNSFTDLQTAITNAAGNLELKLADSYSSTSGTLTIAGGNTHDITIDLNGKTLDGGSNIAIQHNGSGTLTITDTGTGGKVTSSKIGDLSGTVYLNGGSLIVAGGTLENTIAASYGNAITNYSTGSVSISGGTVQSVNSRVICNASTGSVNVSGGTVQITGPGAGIFNLSAGSVSVTGGTVQVAGTSVAISNRSTGSVSVSGGTVCATSTLGYAILNMSTGKITISGTAMVTSPNNLVPCGTIYLYENTMPVTVLEVTGGTVENTYSNGVAIYNYSAGKISIPGGTAIIRGGGRAMNQAPDLSGYTDARVTASNNYDGSSPVTYNPAQITSYKYLAFGDHTAAVTHLTLTDKLTAPATGGTPEAAITEDAQYTGTVSWSGNPAKFLGSTTYTAIVTLTAKSGFTFDGVAQNAFTYEGGIAANPAGSGNTMTVTIVFPATAARTLQSIAVTAAPARTVYKFGDTFSTAGMVVKATYNDGTEDADFTAYTVDKTGALTMSDTTVTLTANGTSIATAQSITVNKADGPAVTGVSAANCTTAGNNDGKLTGVTTGMEYRKSGESGYTPGTGSDINGLTDGDYLVRVRETATHDAGADSTFTVAAYANGPTEVNSFADLQTAITNAAGDLNLKLADSYSSTSGTLTIASGNTHDITIDLNGKTLDGASGTAIQHNGSGTLTITDTGAGGKVTGGISGGTSGTICLSGGSLAAAGGTVENTGQAGVAIYNNGAGKISIPGGTAIIRGGGKAMNQAPDLSGYTDALVTASNNYDGSSPVTYNPAQITSYKYLAFGDHTAAVTHLTLTDKLTAPATGGTPEAAITEDAQYTGTVSWSGNPAKFLGSTTYTAIVTLTAKSGFTFDGVAQNAFTYEGGIAANPAGSGNTMTVTIVFPATAARTLQSIAVTAAPARTVYKFGDTFSTAGMVVKATYNDGTEDADFTAYTVDKTGALTMSDTTVTLTANGTSIATAQSITVNKADGPAVTGVSAANCTTAGNNDGKLTGVTTGMEYRKSGESGYTPGTGSDINGLTDGDYLVRVRETATHNAGADSTFTVAAYVPGNEAPPAPTASISSFTWDSVTMSAVDGGEYSKDGGGNWQDSNIFTGLSAATDYNFAVRIKETDAAPASATSAIVAQYTAAETPATGEGYAINYSAETISIASGYEVSANDDFGTTLTSGDSLIPGTIYYVRKAEDTATTPDTPASAAVGLTLPSRPAVPAAVMMDETVAGKNDGRISGVTTAMEWKAAGGAYAAVTAEQASNGITGLSDGIYYVRYMAVSGVGFNSAEQEITLAAGHTITVTFNSQSGSDVAGITGKAFGDSITAPANPTRSGFYFAGWYKEAACTNVWTFTLETLTGNITLFAKWSAIPTYTVTGRVIDDTSHAVEGAAVRIMQGAMRFGTTGITDTHGDFAIDNVPPGIYNLVITKGTKTAIIKVEVSNGNVAIGNAALPSGNANSVLVVNGSDTPNVVVGGLDSEAGAQLADSGSPHADVVEITLTVEEKDASTAENGNAVASTVKSAGKQVGMILAIDVSKTVNGTEDTSYSQTNGLIEIIIPLPAELQGKAAYAVYRYHGAGVDAITETPNADFERMVIDRTNWTIALYAKKFSTYAIGYTNPVSGDGSDSVSTSTSYTITASAGTGGSIDPSGKVSVKGGSKTFTITANEGYKIAGVKVDGTSVGAMNSYTFSNVGEDHTIAAAFERKETGALPYYVEDGKEIFIGFASDASGTMKYIAPKSATVLFRENPKSFNDIAGHRERESIDFVTERELFLGTGGGNFSPQSGMTRAMFATVIGRLYESSYGKLLKKDNHAFTDVDYDADCGAYIDWTSENSIITGIGGGLFKPDREITRQEMAAILCRFAKFLNVFPSGSEKTQPNYSDAADISSWATEAAMYCRQTGIITGRSGGNFVPQGTATRAEVTAILQRFIESSVK